ncbi:hypothetical protein HDIA_3661 [Hartmannibacter diazotrophicus]|uniref:DUF6455 domain-containing protein n=1 Tax=Hartmannibacter diazotrophicus TaxID=1482074 RepID=A0A2C9DA57_9HYPH|nr:DUF6455 family protein [Hartmannibacter diazotrophicus]SON57202.1 hypothetical protein HDIA_3661 [Hartmannibacter diazotrophicus]
MTDRPNIDTAIPHLMGRMASTLGINPAEAFDPATIEAAAERCTHCPDVAACREWLDLAAIRGADRPPELCANHDLFEKAGQIETI